MDKSMPVRRMDFPFSPEMDRVFVRNDPAMSYLFLGTWMMLPYLEPYLIRSMRQALPHVKDPNLQQDLKDFCAQEGEHFRQHARANDVIRGVNPGFAAMRELEAKLDEEYKRFSREKPLKFNLAYAEGFESLTSAMSCAQLEVGLFDRSDSPLAHLAKWHVMEELEHRTVAFDVYEHVVGSYPYRLRVGTWAQWHFTRWGLRFAKIMKRADRELMKSYDAPEAKADRKLINATYMRQALPRALRIFRPGYNPRQIRLPTNFETIRQTYTELALHTR